MAEVIKDSTSKMTDEDLQAIATYLRSLPATALESTEVPDQDVVRAGQAVYAAQCSACHQAGASA
ncbi:hypothetical protein FJ970_24985 [Mesorhizobium sp. B2-1-8]|uniref:c-type cytochrome n=1 Tax=unclassified Mesorhizobium TaxID=325217 RepID=UPI00112B9E71|nr:MULTISPECIES: c-type cytochrome [unclassified Mesorhizobium]MBZ9673202.1 hypothetical protein [Mesorhizobium sp. ES1-3]UCI18316.1 hypothetical protein FJ970_24985 [Mesorhizobium sp. B2-1-8]